MQNALILESNPPPGKMEGWLRVHWCLGGAEGGGGGVVVSMGPGEGQEVSEAASVVLPQWFIREPDPVPGKNVFRVQGGGFIPMCQCNFMTRIHHIL